MTTTGVKDLFTDLPTTLPEELVELLVANRHVRIERIVSHGHASKDDVWYDQEQDEWVLILKGSARLRFEDQTIEMRPGNFVNISSRRKHRVEWTTPDEPTIWLAVHYGDGA